MRSVIRTSRVAVISALVASAAISALAADANIRTVDRYFLKPGHGAEFVDLAAKYVEIHRKAGSRESWSVWESETGAPEYVVVSYYGKWAELGKDLDPKLKPFEADITRLISRFNQGIDHMLRVVDEVMPDQSYGLSTMKERPKYVRVLVTDVKPDRINDFLEAIKTEVTPAYKKSGCPLYLFSRTRYGGPTTQVRSVIPLEGWASLDSKLPLEVVLGDGGYKALVQKLGAMTTTQEAVIYKYVPEASYTPESSATSSGH